MFKQIHTLIIKFLTFFLQLFEFTLAVMKLPVLSSLMGLLALAMQKKFLKSLLAASSFTTEDKENINSPIAFLVLLKRMTGTTIAFIQELKRILTDCRFANLLIIVSKFHQDHPHLLLESSSHCSAPESILTGSKPSQHQIEDFRRAMIRMSELLSKQDLEIMVAISPIPESSKEQISEGHELFEKMTKYGCISENDTELLQEILKLLELSKPLALLHEYRKAFSTTVNNSGCQPDMYGENVNVSARNSTASSVCMESHPPGFAAPIQTVGKCCTHSRSDDIDCQHLTSQHNRLFTRSTSQLSTLVRCVLNGLLFLGNFVHKTRGSSRSTTKSELCIGNETEPSLVVPKYRKLSNTRWVTHSLPHSHSYLQHHSRLDHHGTFKSHCRYSSHSQQPIATYPAHSNQENGKGMLDCRKQHREDEFDMVIKEKMQNPHPQKRYVWLALFTVTVTFLIVRILFVKDSC